MVGSPVTFNAVAGAPNGKSIAAMRLYVDNIAKITVNAASLTTSQSLGTGSHYVVVNAWIAGGGVLVGKENITVGTPAPITVTLSPGSAQINTGGTQQFSANVQNTPNTTVSWSVDGAPGGNASVGTVSPAGLYSAPGTAGSHTITAASVADSTKSANATVTVIVPSPTVSVSPSSVSVPLSGTQQYNAAIQNSATTSVNWSVDGVAGGDSTTGQISASGLYTAPGSAGTHTIMAALSTDSTIFGSAKAIVYDGSQPTTPGIFTYMYNNGRTGANTTETVLTPAAVSGGKFVVQGSWALDADSFTQPLYVPGVTINGNSYNVLYVGTENDSVYALNADVPGQVLWKQSFLTGGATIGRGFTGGRTSLGANIGITGTPVIDPASNRLYVVGRTTESGNQIQRLHALDLATGADILPNVVLRGSVSGTGMGNDGAGHVIFDPLTQNQRAGLVLSNGVIYVAFAAFSDIDPYHGWLLAYDANTLGPIAAFNTSPNSGGGGIWMAGAAPAADTNGNVYIASANGRPDANALFQPPTDLPNSVLKLKLTAGAFTVVDYFAPFNTRCLSADDLDLGSSAPVLIPDQLLGHNALAVGSKEGRVYLTDSDNMGQFQSASDSQILASSSFNAKGACGAPGFDANGPWRVYGAPAYWNGNIYFGSVFGPLRQYNISNAALQQVALGSHIYQANGQAGRGPLTSISANGSTAGIAWTAENDLSGQGWLRAYDATNVGTQLYFNNFGRGSNFEIPVVANGHVYVNGHTAVYMYGLLP